MRDRFDFEQQLLNTWNIIEEVKTLNQLVLEGKLNVGSMTTDEISNYLMGIETIYSHKFEQLWHDFENVFMDVVRENKILKQEYQELEERMTKRGDI